jgi:hypothetical protein
MPSEVVMTYDRMSLGRRFAPHEFTVDQHLLDTYAGVIGMPASPAPIGLLAVFARRAYLTEGVMPSGGVMASLEVHCTAPLPVGRRLTAAAEVTDRQERRGRGWVTIDITFADAGQPFAGARVLGVWPL